MNHVDKLTPHISDATQNMTTEILRQKLIHYTPRQTFAGTQKPFESN